MMTSSVCQLGVAGRQAEYITTRCTEGNSGCRCVGRSKCHRARTADFAPVDRKHASARKAVISGGAI
jgi:hypothetical protein